MCCWTDLSKELIEVGDVGGGHRWAVAEAPLTAPPSIVLTTRALPLGRGRLWAVKCAFACQVLRAVIIKARATLSPPKLLKQTHLSALCVITPLSLPWNNCEWSDWKTSAAQSADISAYVSHWKREGSVSQEDKFEILKACFAADVPIDGTNWVHKSTQPTPLLLINVD